MFRAPGVAVRLLVALMALATGACTTVTASPPAPGPATGAALTIGVDLPFRALAADESRATWNAMSLYLEQIGGRTGPYSVELVEYDNAPPPHSSWDDAECVRNARAHVANQREVAVIGTRTSACAKAQMPILNQAAGGPMLMVSHADTNPGLTKAWEPDEPARYAGAGLRSFARVVPPDDLQGTAAARFAAEDLGRRTCYVLHDGETYGAGVARAFVAEAGRRGLRTVGPQRWRRDARDYRDLLRRAEAAGADCVFLGGVADNNGEQVIRDKVAVLGDNGAVPLLAPAGFAGYPDLLRSAAADGMYLAQAGLLDAPAGSLPGVPARFLADYRARFGDDPQSARVLYGVLALQVVLAAIARSDGTRVGVRNQLFDGEGLGLTADRSILGRPVTIDPRTGDVRSPDIAIVRIRDGAEAPVTTLPV